MIPLLLTASLLVQLVAAASTNTTSSSECPACNATSCNYRSVWSILGSCALTVFICTWNVIHPNILFRGRRASTLYQGTLMLTSLLAPEYAVSRAFTEWMYARKIKHDFREYNWTLSHSFFALMGGFVLSDGTPLRPKDHLEYLKNESFVNPDITEEEIADRSKSDGLAKVILVLQLSWFILQVVVRGTHHLAITLVEIDTLAMAALSIPMFFFWWNKPMAPRRPHILYLKDTSLLKDAREMHRTSFLYVAAIFNNGYSTESLHRQDDIWHAYRRPQWARQEYMCGRREEVPAIYSGLVMVIGWILLGAVHMIAWDFQFPGQAEKIMWRVTALTLIGAAVVYSIRFNPSVNPANVFRSTNITGIAALLGVVARVLLLALMLASLRDLPPSAHETVSWTAYIPHL
ncbi:hypothetical protein PAXINDRAFT_103058 [Paxillus involutus ATCC 200175]|uniref:Uncharacterized protein n=1 Tax=Paxillus involutus ATCC 200175 TaxID=664439 RepID=A0A0C9TGV2_PAXIN|nr:hypothetical protein PAXINDRAFT_103058 [Paxillus involutus ATCC 200175]